jgi:hypothetical protein
MLFWIILILVDLGFLTWLHHYNVSESVIWIAIGWSFVSYLFGTFRGK